jgi:hypothetical protein
MATQPPQIRNILVAVPSTGGLIKAKTAQSLFRAAHVLTANGFRPVMYNVNGSDVVTVRNLYANTVLNADQWDALLFIDSDMEFEPGLIMRMIEFNAGITSVAYTTRELDVEKLHAAMTDHGDIELARAQASRFNVLTTFNKKSAKVIRKRNGFYSLAASGMGICLIRKSALRAMVKESAVDKRVDLLDGVATESWGFFDQHRVQDVLFLEDYSFCYRWTEIMRRPLWVCVDVAVKHLGDFDYGAPYQPIIDKLLRPLPADRATAATDLTRTD